MLSSQVIDFMVFFLIAIILCLILALFHPYASRLGGTGLWLGKALVSPDLAGVSPRGIQDALTDGTISRITFASAILPYPICAIAFFYSWWAPFVVFIFYVVVAALVAQTNIASKRLDYYINVIQTEMESAESNIISQEIPKELKLWRSWRNKLQMYSKFISTRALMHQIQQRRNNLHLVMSIISYDRL